MGWLVIAAIVVVATVGLHRTAPIAQRFLERNGPPPGEPVGVDPLDDSAPPIPPPSMTQEPPMSPALDATGPTSTA